MQRIDMQLCNPLSGIARGPEVIDPFPQCPPMIERPELVREKGDPRIAATGGQVAS